MDSGRRTGLKYGMRLTSVRFPKIRLDLGTSSAPPIVSLPSCGQAFHPLRFRPAPPWSDRHTMLPGFDRRRCRRLRIRSGMRPLRPGHGPSLFRGQHHRPLPDELRRRSVGRWRFPRRPMKAHRRPSQVFAIPITPGKDDRGNGDEWRGRSRATRPGMAIFAPAEHVTHTAVLPVRRVLIRPRAAVFGGGDHPL